MIFSFGNQLKSQHLVELAPPQFSEIRPVRTNGDCETGKNPQYEGHVRIFTSNNNKSLIVEAYFRTWEYDSDRSDGEYTSRKEIYRVPAGYRIVEVVSPGMIWTFGPKTDTSFEREDEILVSDSCPYRIICNARRDGKDYSDCKTTKGSYMKLSLNTSETITVRIKPN